MKIGNTVRLIQPVIQGEIVDTTFDKGVGKLQHLVAWTDETGERQQRWFSEEQLEVA